MKQTLVTACRILDREGITDGYGETIEQSVQRTIRLAKLGELAHLALLHGEPRWLSAEELDTFSADERFPARGWEYYASRLKHRESF